jgi:hypothetical protein
VLTKLESELISRYWDDIEAALRASVPPLAEATDAALNNIHARLLQDDMQAWALVEMKQDSTKVYALLITNIWEDPGTADRNLLIYALYGYRHIEEHMWKDGLDTLKKYAKGTNCRALVALTSVKRIKDVVESLGGDASTYFITLEV